MMTQDSQLIRTFLAIHLKPQEQGAIYDGFKPLRAALDHSPLHWHAVEKLHITIRFFGATSSEQLAQLKTALTAAISQHHPFQVHFDAPILFPNTHKPVAIALPVKPIPALLALARDAENVAVDCDFTPEQRPYIPHLTLGKIAHRKHIHLPRLKMPHLAHYQVKNLTLQQSVPDERGVSYTPMYNFDLG